MFEKLKQDKALKELENAKKELVVEIDKNIGSSQQSIDDLSKLLSDFKKYKYSKHEVSLRLTTSCPATSAIIFLQDN